MTAPRALTEQEERAIEAEAREYMDRQVAAMVRYGHGQPDEADIEAAAAKVARNVKKLARYRPEAV